MATKTKPNLVTGQPGYSISFPTGAWIPSGSPVSYSPGSVTFQDRPANVDWRKLIKEGKSATTTASGQSCKWSSSEEVCRALNRGTPTWRGLRRISTAYLNLTASPHLSDARNLALGKFIQNCRRTQHAFGAGQFLGELSQTVRFLRSPLEGYRELTASYLRRQRGIIQNSKPKSVTQRLAGTWLGYKFGLMPLLGDIDSGMQELAETIVGKPRTAAVFAKASAETSSSTVSSSNGYAIAFNQFRQLNDVKTTTCYIRGGVNIYVDGPPYAGLNKRVIEDFIPTLYEIYPWSWALDYFTNVGSIISALSYARSNIRWACRSQVTIREITESTTIVGADPVSWIYYDTKGLTGKYRYKLWNRDDISSSAFVPELVFTTPFQSLSRSMNLIAALLTRTSF